MKLLTDATLNSGCYCLSVAPFRFQNEKYPSCPGTDSVAVFAASLLLGAGQLHPFATGRTVTQVGLMTPNFLITAQARREPPERIAII